MAAVAGRRQRVVRRAEGSAVFLLDRRLDLPERLVDDARNGVLLRDRGVLVRRVVLDYIVEPLADFVELVSGEVPVLGLSRKIQLGVPHLLEAHDLAEPWR